MTRPQVARPTRTLKVPSRYQTPGRPQVKPKSWSKAKAKVKKSKKKRKVAKVWRPNKPTTSNRRPKSLSRGAKLKAEIRSNLRV